MAYQSSTADWRELASMRKRGQRPHGFIAIADTHRRREHWMRLGFMALPLPAPDQCFLLAGLWVLLDVDRNGTTSARALEIATSRPKRLQIAWRNEAKFEAVIP
jgi:hypothetical protein